MIRKALTGATLLLECAGVLVHHNLQAVKTCLHLAQDHASVQRTRAQGFTVVQPPHAPTSREGNAFDGAPNWGAPPQH